MDDQDHLDEQYDEPQYTPEIGYPSDHEQEGHLDDAEPYSANDATDANDEHFYDSEAQVDSPNVDYEEGNDNVDYEPPSPSYPYPEDQLPPDSELQIDDLDGREDVSRNPRHVSELYTQDVLANEMDQGNSVISEYLKSRDPDWDNIQQRTEPLNLLELPVDVLRLIVKEVCMLLLLLCAPYSCETVINFSADHSYKRSYLSRPDQLDPPQPRDPPHLLALRHSLA